MVSPRRLVAGIPRVKEGSFPEAEGWGGEVGGEISKPGARDGELRWDRS